MNHSPNIQSSEKNEDSLEWWEELLVYEYVEHHHDRMDQDMDV